MRNLQFPLFITALSVLAARLLVAAADSPQPSAAVYDYDRDVSPLLKKYCYECHSGDEGQGDIYLDIRPGPHGRALSPIEREEYEKMIWVLHDQEMPPKDEQQPTVKERALLLDWIIRDRLRLESGASQPAAEEQPSTEETAEEE